MSSHPPKAVLITGASSGIGEVTAIHLARRGYNVLATSRDLTRLDRLIALARADSLTISAYQLDINNPASVGETIPQIIAHAGELDALINNAGYILWGCLEDLSLDELKAQFETNLFAVLRMSQAVLPHMRERRTGTIVNVGSIAGQIGSPAGGAYAASKFALQGLSKVLRMEVAQFGIRVVLIEPGLFRTNLARNRIAGEHALDPASPYYAYVQKIRQGHSGSHSWAGDPMKVAKTIGKVLASRHPQQRYAVGADARLGVMATRLLPDGVLEYFVKRVVVR